MFQRFTSICNDKYLGNRFQCNWPEHVPIFVTFKLHVVYNEFELNTRANRILFI